MQTVNENYSAVQQRSDRWTGLREVIDQFDRGVEGKKAATLKTKANTLFDGLSVIERYWAFPASPRSIIFAASSTTAISLMRLSPCAGSRAP